MSCTVRTAARMQRSKSPTSLPKPRSARGHVRRIAMTASPERTNLLGMTRPALEAFVGAFGAKPYRARQLLKWIYRRGESDFARMTDLAKDFRAELAARAEV